MQKFFSLFTSKNSLGVASIILITTTALSRLMGIPRDYFLAQKIPAENISIYHAAFLIPDFIVNILIIGAISAAFIPVFINYLKTKSEGEAFKVANLLLNLVILVILIYSVVMFIFAPYVMKLIVPGFSPEKIENAALISRILIINPIFFAFAYVFGGILNSFKRFLAYSLAPICYNLGIILGTIFFADKFGIMAPAWGAVFGAFLHMLIQAIPAFALGFRYKPLLDLKNPGVREIGRLMLPRTIGLAASQISFVIIIAIASLYDSKGIALFNFANNMAAFIPSVFGITLAIAIFPILTEKIALGQKAEFMKNFSLIFREIVFLTLPLTVLLILFRAQIVRIFLGSGYFDWDSTIITASILGMMGLYIFAQGLIALLARSFYALKDTSTPVKISIFSILITIISGYFLARGISWNGEELIPSLGVVGLGLALSLGEIVHLIWLILVLRKRIGTLDEKIMLLDLSKIVLATLLMAGIVQGGKFLIEPLINTHTRLGLIAQVGIISLVGIGLYLGVGLLFKLPEPKKLLEFFQRKTKVRELTEVKEV